MMRTRARMQIVASDRAGRGNVISSCLCIKYLIDFIVT